MTSIVANLVHGYRDLMDNKSDPRVNEWPMMSSPFPTVAICMSYVYFSKVLGPRLMENRKPFELRGLLITYNLVQTLFSLWIFYEYLMSGWARGYSFRCQPVDYSNSPLGLRMAQTCWWYYFSKFTEFFDTLFFILRKKNQHVSTLHVIHHGVMPFSVWMGLKFAPGGHSTFFALLNTFVHIIMYFYYMVAAMGPEYQKYIWWKKYLTTLQMVQFVMIMTHQFQLLFTECDYPRSFMIWIGLHGVLFLGLFSDFYKSKYTEPSRSARTKCRQENGHTSLGACMPVLDDETRPKANGVSSYATIYNSEYNSCYSNGTNNGYVANNNTEKKLA
ncbi:elongation of very long chain fatty acids protein AAEL008004 [Orussus abietinus]|uniref:elongation of very long chain fatty acids protein AAEL008004 n=1 Tax=Orussus abietinus TaxID=222816 RepID=UPI000626CC77|nr:elongation of very long chain fatty acids protein AAEL008004 [Orussus abietinus]XP_012288395.1 elongation of very long chain fatty acids protein AAEL008004 [Orussus abietinus]XP_012288396.1 elongation of very long chain fatty acids protein AAEL008004 [Orussus abietinus]XP_012288397.1 elongation of very long chain fatty acids protein AAEL008004 [Orussus abietinus]XP_012288398.1 elongation of very long chain fatty acids protein AAEL008004 [Orussus abietinus]XP_012288399.1 elongation of very l